MRTATVLATGLILASLLLAECPVGALKTHSRSRYGDQTTYPVFSQTSSEALKGRSSYRSSSSSSGTEGGSDIAAFIFGCIMIPFSLVLLWKNERKVVMFSRCMDTGRKVVISVDATDPDDANELDLVHVTGTTVSTHELIDKDFGVVAKNSYRLKRKVEMYQWRATLKGSGDHQTTSYDGVWSETRITSTDFPEIHRNPSNPWPFQSRTFEASSVQLGKYRLRPDQILRLGLGQTKKVSLDEESSIAIHQTSSRMRQEGFEPFEQRGIYLVSSATDNSETAPHIGQFRVTFEYDLCGPATIIAQQVQNEEGQHTFRKWNPDKIQVPYGQSTDADNGMTQGNALLCYICMCVDGTCNAVFEEVVDLAVDTKLTVEAYFDDQDKKIQTSARLIRPAGILLNIMGIFLLFWPIIALLKWIPLVGSLLGFAAAFAAGLVALIVGTVVSCLVIALAWLVYRPLIGVSLLVLVAIGVYFIFFFPISGDEETAMTAVADSAEDDSTIVPTEDPLDDSITT